MVQGVGVNTVEAESVLGIIADTKPTYSLADSSIVNIVSVDTLLACISDGIGAIGIIIHLYFLAFSIVQEVSAVAAKAKSKFRVKCTAKIANRKAHSVIENGAVGAKSTNIASEFGTAASWRLRSR